MEVQPFQLETLEVEIGFIDALLKKTWYPSQLGQDLLRLLQRQRSLRRLRLNVEGDPPSDTPLGAGMRDLTAVPEESPKATRTPSDQVTVGQWREACRSLEVLEGSRTVVRLLLPGATGVKAVFWKFGHHRSEERSWASGWDAAQILEESWGWGDFFTPDLCEAYGRLEHLFIAFQIHMLPVLVPFLTSLKTLVLYIAKCPFFLMNLEKEERKRLLLDTIVQIGNLETLAIIQGPRLDVDPEPEVVFARCPKLRELVCATCDSIAIRSTDEIVSMERGADGTVHRADYEAILRKQYVMGGWASIDADYWITYRIKPRTSSF